MTAAVVVDCEVVAVVVVVGTIDVVVDVVAE